MSEEKKKLNVVAVTDFSEYGDSAVLYGALLAKIFDGILMVFTHFRLKNREFAKKSSEDSIENLDFVRAFFPETTLEVHNEKTDARQLYAFAESHNVGIFVIGSSEKGENNYFSRKRAFKFILPSRQPVLCVGALKPTENAFKNVLLPLDLRPQNKEKVLWAGYFNRFYQSKVHILYSYFPEEHLQNELERIVEFAKKLYANLEITDYEIHQIKPTEDNMDRYSLEFASAVDATLTVVLMTHNRSIGDFLLGVREKTLIGNRRDFPVLCINERPDLYVLCT